MEPRTRRRRNPVLAYLPFIAIAVVVVVIAAFFALRDDGGGDTAATGSTRASTENGPLTFEQAREQGVDTSAWPHCDQERGRITIPSNWAPPCVEPFDGDNGGATAPGVTAESIKIVVYLPDPKLDPLQTAFFQQSGVNTSVEAAQETFQGYIDLFQEYFETYGRRIDVEYYIGTGAPDDEVKARADGIAVAEKKPFAVLNGPTLAISFRDEIVSRGIVCVGYCALATPDAIALESGRDGAPSLMWSVGPSTDQANLLVAEMVGKQLAGKPAEYAGDELADTPRKFGFLWYEAPDGRFGEGHAALVDRLRDEYDVELAVDSSFLLDIPRGQEVAATLIARMRDAGVTTILYSGDPIMPTYFTRAATQAGYFPEWVVTSSVLVDTSIFGRQYDPEQWRHAFGLSLQPARGVYEVQPGYLVYDWGYCTPPPSNTFGVIWVNPLEFFIGVHLAGPELSARSWAEGLFRYPVSGGTPLLNTLSWGEHDIWPTIDLNGTDDVAFIWWDPEAEGNDESGNSGVGMWAYVDGGERHTYGKLPTDPVPFFDPDGAVTIYEELPEQWAPPQYPSPCEP